ncbi:hypothetical protein B0T25DRAFT_570295 [Lasiosphaeria hispida]|uniref:Clr5 domain-containing protein n=1 Tax=Lasiosphaeria hispida TaxID=260671 RepID=A0AAJ0HF41_9PEZI|nr:hypothetical protein B0T25DRAFT_570295 [Lasiosphaeria hispida]
MAGFVGTSSSKPWSGVYDTVYQLYWFEDRTLDETMSIMKNQHNFSATKKQWISKLDQWKLKKNISTKEMQNLVRIQRKRKMEEDKDTNFSVREKFAEVEKKPSGKSQLLGQLEEIWHAFFDIATRIPHQYDQSRTVIVKLFKC